MTCPFRFASFLFSIPAVALIVMLSSSVAVADKPAKAWTPPDDSWIRLFNGKDFTGWKLPNADHNWQVIDGVIDYEAKGGNLLTEREFGDYQLHIEWRFKRTSGKPYRAKLFNPDGTQKTDKNGKPLFKDIPNADSGIFLRGSGKSQTNLWCWPCGSGQLWAFHTSKDPEVRKGALPKENADKPVGEWNAFDITMKGERVTIVNNGKTVINNAPMPGIPAKGAIVLQHHGGINEKTKKFSPASALIQFRNIWIKPLK